MSRFLAFSSISSYQAISSHSLSPFSIHIFSYLLFSFTKLMQMKSSISLVPFIILFLLVKSQGIRLESRSITTHHEIQEERSSIEGSAVGEEVVICKDGHCSGRSRKLMTPAKAPSESARNKGVEVEVTTKKNSHTAGSNGKNFDVESPELEHQVSAAESYPDSIDIAGMDYSPAKRKPPIHN